MNKEDKNIWRKIELTQLELFILLLCAVSGSIILTALYFKGYI